MMPGLGASPEIFEFLNFNKGIELIKLSWIPPKSNEKISDYALRMSKKIIHKDPYVMGVSFGGLLVQEMSRHIKFKKIIIVSSIKSNKEMPFSMIMAKKTKAYLMFPSKWINNLEDLVSFVFGKLVKRRIKLYKKYLSERDPKYLSWAINELINWNRTKFSEKIIHIHGDKDNIFPISKIKNPIIIKGGNHAMILIKSSWFNKNLPLILQDDFLRKNN